MIKLLPSSYTALTTFPFIEGDFDKLTQYELTQALVEKINEVITQLNGGTADDSVSYYVRPDMYGVVYNDSSKADDNVTALQQAIDYAALHNYPVVIPADIYISDAINLSDGSTILSDGHKIIQTSGYRWEGHGQDYGFACFLATDKKDILIDGVYFENTGYSRAGGWDYADDPTDPVVGFRTWDGWGVGCGFARCLNVVVRNCRFFKCGGKGHLLSGGGYHYAGFAIWFSCCKNCIASGNIIEACHNGICADRWFRDTAGAWFNLNITISDNLIRICSGDAIGLEGHGDTSNIVVSNNNCYSIMRALVALSINKGVVIDGNTLDNAPEILTNPYQAFGLAEAAWNWTMTALPLYPAIRAAARYCRDITITGNIIKYATKGVYIPSGYNIIINGNVINNCSEQGVYLGGMFTDDGDDRHGAFEICGNSIIGATDAIYCVLGSTGQLEGVTIIGNKARSSSRFAHIVGADDLRISDNAATGPLYLSYCHDAIIDAVVKDVDTALEILGGYGIRGKIITDAAGPVIVATATTGSTYLGSIELVIIGDEPTAYIDNTDLVHLNIRSGTLPTVGASAGDRWDYNGGAALAAGDAVMAVYTGSVWSAIASI